MVTITPDARRALVGRVVGSRYIARSARLRDLLRYLSRHELEGRTEIREQEVGQEVFGRPANYDTGADNIVRVHASQLRKRLEQYFESEGAAEPVILEIPKGNYLPVFRERAAVPAPPPPASLTEPQVEGAAERSVAAEPRRNGLVWGLAGLAILFAAATAYLWFTRPALSANGAPAARPNVDAFWAELLQPNVVTDIVLDDAAIGFYQELTARPLTLSGYFDRAYLRNLPEAAATAKLPPDLASAITLRRHTSYAGASFLWKVMQVVGARGGSTQLRFARDYSFRELRSANVILFGNSHSNPWIEAFEQKIGVHWKYDAGNAVYIPADSWNGDKVYVNSKTGDGREGFCSIALVPNLAGTSHVLIMGGTGGSAVNLGAEILNDEESMKAILQHLGAEGQRFPAFETLIRVHGRSASPRDAVREFVRRPKG